jgi:hypothetical protein
LASLAIADEGASKAQQITVFEAGTLSVPAEFQRVPVKSRIIHHEFQARAGEGDDRKTARVYMMPSGGGVEQNIERWKSQFSGIDKQAQKTTQLDLGQWKLYIVDIAGSFKDRVGGGPFAGGKVVQRPDHAMCGAILVHPDGRQYYVKMIGPAAVVKANRDTFVKMVKTIEK